MISRNAERDGKRKAHLNRIKLKCDSRRAMSSYRFWKQDWCLDGSSKKPSTPSWKRILASRSWRDKYSWSPLEIPITIACDRSFPRMEQSHLNTISPSQMPSLISGQKAPIRWSRKIRSLCRIFSNSTDRSLTWRVEMKTSWRVMALETLWRKFSSSSITTIFFIFMSLWFVMLLPTSPFRGYKEQVCWGFRLLYKHLSVNLSNLFVSFVSHSPQ